MAHSVKLYLDKIPDKKKRQILSIAESPRERKSLEKKLETKKLPVFLYLRFKGKTIKVYVDRKFTVKQWDFALNMPRGVEVETMQYLQDVVRVADDLYDKYGPSVTKEKLKEQVDILNGKFEEDDSNNTGLSFFEFVEQFINEEESNKNKNTSTISVYRTTLSHIKEFQKKKGYPVNWKTINLNFYEQFRSYLRNEKVMPKKDDKGNEVIGMLDGTIGKYIKTIKTFLNEATERGYTVNQAYKSKKFKVDNEEAENVYLNEQEIMKLYKHDFSKNKRLERVRDLFVAACWLGLRFSDLHQVTERNIYNIDGGTFVRLNTIKTGENVVIPCHPIVENVLNKYEGQLPNNISNQKLNDYLEEVCKEVGFEELIHLYRKKGSERLEISKHKYQLITSHTARRSFATNLYLRKVPVYTIMAITGHRTEKAFLKYIKVTKEEHARILMDLMKTQNFFN